MNKGITFARLALTAILSLTLIGCNDGDTIVVEEGDPIIVPVVDSAERALVTIDKVVENDDHTVTINFSASNENDVALIGLTGPRFTMSKLVPEQDGQASEWVSLINKAVSNEAETLTVLQATYDRDQDNEEGRFEDKGNGTYTFKLKETVLTATNPITGDAISWDANATHRVGMQVSANSNNIVNATFDWVPSGGGLIDQRNIVDSATCNNCHGELKLHGSRVEIKYCVTCHNPGSTDPDSENTVDFTPMIHKIHRGANLPSMLAKGDGAVYEIIGYRGTAHTYAQNEADSISGVTLPQDIRNCSNCHTADNENTPQGDNWKTSATLTACSSCHDDIAFSQEDMDTDLDKDGMPWKREHPIGFVAEDSCLDCHAASDTKLSAEYPHETVRKQAKAADELLDISFVRVERVVDAIEVDVQINYDGQPVDDFASFAATYTVGGKGYLLVNADEGLGYTKSYGVVNHNLADPTICVPQTAGLFTCTVTTVTEVGTLSLMTSDLPLCANGRSSVPELIDCSTTPDWDNQVERIPAKHVEGFYDLGDGTTLGALAAVDDYVERIGADISKCQNCHSDDGLHMGSHPHAGTDIAQCTNCHNATRSSYYTGRPADLKSHVHTLHSSNDSTHPMEDYPNDIATCTACHTDEQYNLPIQMNVRSSASGPSYGVVTYSSPTATVCSSCHVIDMPVGLIAADGTMDAIRAAGLSDEDLASNTKVITHILDTGGAYGQISMDDADAALELCSGCHKKGEVKGVDAVHGL